MSAMKSSLLIIFLSYALSIPCLGSLLIEKATDTVNEMFDYREITCIVWRNADPEGINQLLERFNGSVVTVSLQQTIRYSNFHKLVKYKQTILFAKDPEEFSYFLYLVVKRIVMPIGVILILTEPLNKNSVLSDLMKLAWENDIGDIIIISVYGKEDNVTLTTYNPYSDGRCGNYNPVILKDNASKHLRKFRNFQTCPVRVTAIHSIPYFLFGNDISKVEHVSGIDGDVLSLVMERLNATMNFVAAKEHDEIGEFVNGNGTGLFGDLFNGIADIIGPTIFLTFDRYSVAQTSYVYHALNLVWCLPERREIPAWFKVLLPFFTYTTLIVILVFILILILIMLIEHCGIIKTTFRNVPIQMLGICVGQPIKFLTKNWLANGTLILWIWFCLIIRVVYQCDLVESFELTILEPPVTTVKEALRVVEGHGGYFAIKDFYRNTSIEVNFHTINLSQSLNYIKQVANGERFLLAANEILIKYLNYSVQILEERVTSTPTCFYMRPRWPAANEIDKLIERITEAGFVSKIMDDYVGKQKFPNNFVDRKIIKPIELSVLVACFYSLIAMYVICTIIFTLELGCYKYAQQHALNK